MHLAHKSFTKIIYLLVFLAAIIFISLLPSPSYATVQSQQLPHAVVPMEIKANTDNTLSYFHCQVHAYNAGSLKYYGRQLDTNQFKSYIDTRTVVNGTLVINPYINDCSKIAHGKGSSYFLKDDGSLIGNFQLLDSSGKTYQALALHKDGNFKWERSIDISCPNNQIIKHGIHQPTEGYDGHIYGIMINQCHDNDHRFISLNVNDGSIRFSIPLSINGDYYSIFYFGHYIDTYDEGVVVLDENTLRFFDYNGVEDTNSSNTINPPPNTYPGRLTVAPNGKVYTLLREGSSIHRPCKPGSLGYDEIYYFEKEEDQSGTIQVDSCGAYAPISQIVPDPNGGLIILTEVANHRHYIIRYDESNQMRNSTTVPYESGWSTATSTPSLHVDNLGNVIIARNMIKGYGDRDQHVMTYLITPSGDISKVFSTEEYDTPQTQRYTIASTRGLSLNNGNVYLGICHTQCTHTNPAHIYTISVPGLGSEYPSNLIGTAIPGHDIDNDGDGLTKWQEIQQGTSDDSVDSDGDGLDDFLESRWNPDRHDLFCNNDRSVCEYPNPSEKDIYVEVDWMTRPAENGVDSYTTKPSGDQIDEIKEAFANKGIHAHFDTGQLGGGNEVPYNHVVKFGVILNEIDFYDYKKGGDGISANFNPDRYQIYHYMLSGYRFNEPPAPASSGVALVSDDDFFVSFGALKEDFGFVWPGNSEKAITGTIIHELGHNLCLTSNTHNDPACSFEGIDANYGNSYPSAMNYDRQFELIDYSTGENGSGDHDDWGALRLNDFASSNIGDEAHDLLQSMQQQTMRMRSPLHLQPQYREFQNKLREFDRSVERHE